MKPPLPPKGAQPCAKIVATASCLALLWLAACSPPQDAGPVGDKPQELQAVPEPDLDDAEEAVRRQIEAQREEVEGLAGAGAAERGQAYGELGLLYLTYSFLEAAEACFSNARSLQPEDYRWPYLLGYLWQIQGRLEEAAAVLQRTLELRPDDLPSRIRLARVRLELGSPEAAAPLFERVLERDPGSAAALDGLGSVAAARGDSEAAVGFFERALEKQPAATSVHHALGLAYRKLGDLDKARFHLGRGGDAAVQFVDPLLSSVAELGRSAEIFLVRAAQAFAEERYQQAAGYYRRALEIDPANFTTRKAYGFCLEKLGDVDGAIAELEEALRSATSGDEERDVLERSEVLRILGGLRVLQGREREAIEVFRQALELDPSRLDTRSKLANALARQGQLEEAVEHFDRVLAAKSDLPEVLVQRATARINLGRHAAALADFERAVEIAPEDAEVRLRYAEALDHLGNGTAAAAQRDAAAGLASDPEAKSRLLTEEAGRRLRRGEVDAALAQTREALRLDGANADARYQLATILGHLGRLDEALSELARVIEAAPLHGPARRAEVTALALQGRWTVARSRLQDGLEAMPRDRDLAHALARLLAAAPADAVRDGELALRIASRVHQEEQSAASAETLAAAFAEAGRFAEALELQRQLVGYAEQSGRGGPAAAHWRGQLAAYEASEPWRLRSADELIAVLRSAAAASAS